MRGGSDHVDARTGDVRTDAPDRLRASAPLRNAATRCGNGERDHASACRSRRHDSGAPHLASRASPEGNPAGRALRPADDASRQSKSGAKSRVSKSGCVKPLAWGSQIGPKKAAGWLSLASIRKSQAGVKQRRFPRSRKGRPLHRDWKKENAFRDDDRIGKKCR